MAYQVDRYNGTFLTSVEDGTIDTTTDLRFVGKNYAGYGEVQNENFLHLLENFSNTSSPSKPVSGQIWYDATSTIKRLKFWDGGKWRTTTGAEVAATAPSGLSIGDFWWDTSAKQLYAYTGTEFVLVGPEASPDLGASAVLASVVKDSLNNNHTIVKLQAGGKVVGIVSQTEFTLNSSVNPIEDFSVVKKGITLAKTNTAGVSTDSYTYWGTASNSAKLGGVDAANFVQKGSIVFDNEIGFKDPGLQIGDTNDLRIRIENSDEAVIENRLGNDIVFRITVTDAVDERNVLVIKSTGIVPGIEDTYNIGTSATRWNNIYAVEVFANVTGNVTGNLTGSTTGNLRAVDSTVMVNGTTKEIGYAGASLKGNLVGSVEGNLTGTATNANKLTEYNPSIEIPSTINKAGIPVRDTDGNLNATRFIGIADKADQLIVSGVYRSTATTATANTVASRDSSGDLYAVLFQGTATAARYADLAEKYLADKEYEAGTVVMIGGEAEVTESTWGKRAIGVVSTNPAFMMNKDLEGGTYIALKGRVPVKVIGRIKKGEDLIAANNGCAMMAVPHASGVFAVALESSDDEGVKTIEALIL
jgi:hypothetical protein